ncbi:hypothetical protein GCM10029964_057330 [Kibdelosporangium lantanae]
MVSGKVLRFDDVRGYGFIAPDDGGEDVFMHANDLRDEKFLFTPGTTVEFDVVEGDRGLKASSVRVVERGPTRSGGGPAADEEVMCDVLSPANSCRNSPKPSSKRPPPSPPRRSSRSASGSPSSPTPTGGWRADPSVHSG